jgi:hypothetical protein
MEGKREGKIIVAVFDSKGKRKIPVPLKQEGFQEQGDETLPSGEMKVPGRTVRYQELL